MTAEHEHKWVFTGGGGASDAFICNVSGCGKRCDAAPKADLDTTRAELNKVRSTVEAREEVKRLDVAGVTGMTALAARTSESLGDRADVDMAVVFVGNRGASDFGVSAFAPGLPIEVAICTVIEALMKMRRAAHSGQGG